MAIPKMSGVSLLATIRQFSDPVAWAEFEQLLGLGGGDTEARAGWNADDWKRHDFQVSLSLEGARLRSNDSVTASHRWARLRTAFKAKLQSGELVATGYAKPVKLTDSRTTIPADKWQFLELDFINGAASGEGLEIVSILIDRAEHASELEAEPDGRQWPTPLRVTPKERPEIEEGNKSASAAPDPHFSGFPGRPSKGKHLIEQEFERRVDAGEVCSTLPEEAGALLEWLKEEHPSAPPPTVKTIKNNLRGAYRRINKSSARNSARN